MGRWPAAAGDLEGTEYLKMPYRRAFLEEGKFVVLWQELDPDPRVNAERVLAYDNTSLFAKLGWVWVCRGDLRLELMRRGELRTRGVLASGAKP